MTVRIAKVDTVILQDSKFSHFRFDGRFPERGRPGPRRLRPGRHRRMRCSYWSGLVAGGASGKSGPLRYERPSALRLDVLAS
jgi:hypothetical protein